MQKKRYKRASKPKLTCCSILPPGVPPLFALLEFGRSLLSGVLVQVVAVVPAVGCWILLLLFDDVRQVWLHFWCRNPGLPGPIYRYRPDWRISVSHSQTRHRCCSKLHVIIIRINCCIGNSSRPGRRLGQRKLPVWNFVANKERRSRHVSPGNAQETKSE